MTTMIMMTTTTIRMTMTTTRMSMTIRVTHLWNLIKPGVFARTPRISATMMMMLLIRMTTLTTMTRRKTPYQTKPNNTKMGITRTFLKLQASDFAW